MSNGYAVIELKLNVTPRKTDFKDPIIYEADVALKGLLLRCHSIFSLVYISGATTLSLVYLLRVRSVRFRLKKMTEKKVISNN